METSPKEDEDQWLSTTRGFPSLSESSHREEERNHTQIREAKAEPEERGDDRLQIASLPDSELTETDQPVEGEPTPQRDQEPVSTLCRSMRQRRPPSRFKDLIMD